MTAASQRAVALKRRATELGFDAVGIATLERNAHAAELDRWEVVRRGLEDARGNYKIVARMFNLEADDYKRFLNFLRKHDCQLSFKEFR